MSSQIVTQARAGRQIALASLRTRCPLPRSLRIARRRLTRLFALA